MENKSDVQRLTDAMNTGKTVVFYLDRLGCPIVDEITTEIGDSLETIIERMVEWLSVGKPSFEICYVLRGELRKDGDTITIEDVPKLIELADAERVRFYTEREQVY